MWSEILTTYHFSGLKPLLRRLCLLSSLTLPFPPDEREHVQKKTFTKWVNSHLVRINCKITDLYTDLRDGKMLIKLLEILSGERLVSSSHLPLCVPSHKATKSLAEPIYSPQITQHKYNAKTFSASPNQGEDENSLPRKCGQGAQLPL